MNIINNIIIIIYVLLISSLLTVLERKVLSICHRRIGPSYNGWYGLMQIIADGIKLIYKDINILGLLRSINKNINLYLPPIISFIFSYNIILIVWYNDMIIIIDQFKIYVNHIKNIVSDLYGNYFITYTF